VCMDVSLMRLMYPVTPNALLVERFGFQARLQRKRSP
jgi:hypothetical protein